MPGVGKEESSDFRSLCAGSWVNPSEQRKTFEFKLFEGGRLFRLSIFSLKMTLSLFLFKTELQHKNSKTL